MFTTIYTHNCPTTKNSVTITCQFKTKQDTQQEAEDAWQATAFALFPILEKYSDAAFYQSPQAIYEKTILKKSTKNQNYLQNYVTTHY